VRIVDGFPANAGLSFAYSLVYLFAILAAAYLFSAIICISVYSLIVTLAIFLMGARKPSLYSIARAVGYRMEILPPSATGARV
jgi:hypothetical protein